VPLYLRLFAVGVSSAPPHVVSTSPLRTPLRRSSQRRVKPSTQNHNTRPTPQPATRIHHPHQPSRRGG
jgi:hypothetical protein